MTAEDYNPIVLADSPAIDFIDNRLASVHPALSNLEPRYNQQRGCYVRKQPDVLDAIQTTDEMRRQVEMFREAVKKHERATKQPVGINLDPSAGNVYTWSDVLAELDKAQHRYNNVKKAGMLGSFRHCIRSFYKLQQPIESWLRLLPSESWQGSLLCGGIKIVLGAAGSLEKMREDIANALEQIPCTIDKVQSLLGVYSHVVLRQSHVSQLFVMILEVLQHCLLWFSENPGRKAMKALFTGDAYGQKLRDKVDCLKQLERRIDEQAIVGLHQGVSHIDWKADVLMRMTADNVAVLEHMRVMLMNQDRMDQDRAALVEETRLIREKLELERRAFTLEKKSLLLGALGYDVLACRDDLYSSLDIGPALYQDTRDRAGWILQSPDIAQWLSSKSSSILVVNGNGAHHERDSAVSLFSAMLTHALAGTSDLAISWFCGRQAAADARCAAKSLLGQVVEAGVPDMPIPPRGVAGELDDAETVVALLSGCIVRQLQKTNVYCILDSVSFYEGRDRLADLLLLYRELVAIVETCAQKHQLKVLVTSPIKCSYMGTFQDDSNAVVLTVPDVASGLTSDLGSLAFLRQD